MQETPDNITLIVIVISSIFMLAAVFLFAYVILYAKRKRRHKEEKMEIKKDFEAELIKTEIEVQEQTRQSLAADIHDNIGQILSLTNVTLASIDLKDTEKSAQKVNAAHELVTRSIKELRQLSKLIHGEKLVQQSLEIAIRQEISWLERNDYYTINLNTRFDNETKSNPDKDLIIYRIFQEALNNIVKHADAATISIDLLANNHLLTLSLHDDGKGFDPDEINGQKKGMGLSNMERRINIINGRMQIQSSHLSGTSIHFFIPYP